MVATEISFQQYKHAYSPRFFAEEVERIATIELTPILLETNV